jgi:hypothetical protein
MEDRTAFTLSLVDGAGGEDNSSFEITGNSLKVKAHFLISKLKYL